MRTEDDVLNEVSEILDGINDETVARVMYKLGKRHGIPVVAYSTRDVQDVLLDIAGDHPNVMMSKFPSIVDDVIHSDKWREAAEHAQDLIEQDLYDAVSESVRKLA